MILLETRNLFVSVKNRQILKGLNLQVKKGEKIIILGSNGAGKTTLIESIMGFVKPDKGSIFFIGKELKTEEDFKCLRRRIGYVFQNPEDQLFSPTVEEELAFAPINLGISSEKTEELIEQTLKLFKIEHLRHRNIHDLSGGEKRLVSIACVLTMNPEALILDEPSAYLDDENVRLVAQFLNETEKTVIVTTHDKEFVKLLGWKTYLLKNGVLHIS